MLMPEPSFQTSAATATLTLLPPAPDKQESTLPLCAHLFCTFVTHRILHHVVSRVCLSITAVRCPHVVTDVRPSSAPTTEQYSSVWMDHLSVDRLLGCPHCSVVVSDGALYIPVPIFVQTCFSHSGCIARSGRAGSQGNSPNVLWKINTTTHRGISV